MFLDDLLYQTVKETKIEKSEDFQDLVSELWMQCHTRCISELSPNSSYKEIAIVLDRTFNAWNLLISKLEKRNGF